MFVLVSGPAKRYRVKAIQTSRRCNIICMYTTFAATDRSTATGLAGSLEVRAGETPARLATNAFIIITHIITISFIIHHSNDHS